MRHPGEIEIRFTLDAAREICPLLFQSGVLLKVQVGVSIENFLCKQIGLDKTYVDERISTIFLNGQPVDDIGKAIIKNNDTLALSGAMPGILGATLRRDSCLALLRGTITLSEYGNDIAKDYGLIYLKLFNLISREVGPLVLQRGIMANPEKVSGFFRDKMSEEADIYLDGKKAGLDELREISKADIEQKPILLKVRIFS